MLITFGGVGFSARLDAAGALQLLYGDAFTRFGLASTTYRIGAFRTSQLLADIHYVVEDANPSPPPGQRAVPRVWLTHEGVHKVISASLAWHRGAGNKDDKELPAALLDYMKRCANGVFGGALRARA